MATLSQILWDNNQLFADIEGLVFSDDKIIEIDYKKFGNEASVGWATCCPRGLILWRLANATVKKNVPPFCCERR